MEQARNFSVGHYLVVGPWSVAVLTVLRNSGEMLSYAAVFKDASRFREF